MNTEMQLWNAVDRADADARYNIVRPSESILAPNPLMSVYANIVTFAETDCYSVDGGKMALNGVALAKIASGAGISFVNVVRMDDGRDADVSEVSVLAAMKRADGSVIHATGKKRVDVKAYVQQKYGPEWQGNADAKKMYNQMRKFSSERAETGAKSRAIRQLLGMKASYTKDELRKPFVIPQVTVNMAEIVKDEFGRRLAMAQALNAGSLLFGAGVDMTLGTASSAALPAGSAVENHPALPPAGPSAAQQPADPTPEEVMLDQWTTARPGERAAKISALLAEREHGLSDKAVDELYSRDGADQAKLIVWLHAKPMRNGNGANGTPPPHDPEPPATTGTVGGNEWKPSEKQIKRLYGIAKHHGYDSEALHEFIAQRFGGITSIHDLTRDQYDTLTGHEANPEYNQELLVGLLEQHPFTSPVDEAPASDGLPL